MLERVYGRQMPEQLAAIMARAMGLTPVSESCSRVVTAARASPGFRALAGPDGHAASVTDSDSESPKNTEAQPAFAAGPTEVRALLSVPGGGIEPPTRGFSGQRSRRVRPRPHIVFPRTRAALPPMPGLR